MTRDGVVGRLLTASLHQSIGDVLPTRLDFYEGWLRPESLHDGRLGRAPLVAVLSFLRQEGGAYDEVMARAGAYAADWALADLSGLRRSAIGAAPEWLRRRLALGLARTFVRGTFHGSQASVRWRKGVGRVDIRGSLFCDVRGPASAPLCGFYGAAIARLLEAFTTGVEVRTEACRATGGDGCAITVAKS
jgi:predicted hydrocarbon binding protein